MPLRAQALALLQIQNPAEKCRQTLAWQPATDLFDTSAHFAEPHGLPCRPERPVLVAPSQVQRRTVHTPEGRAILIHALTHIELNAIDLALDIVWRFPDLPQQFYLDWMAVAKDEAKHFTLLNDHLASLGFQYGDFTAHNGMWDMAEKTKNNLLARLAVVPRTMEARGLDVTPQIRDKLRSAGDPRGADILEIILQEEIGHVAAGNRWYRWLCQQSGLDSILTYQQLAVQYCAPRLRGPFNLEARRAAGFDEAELAALCQ